VTAAVIPLRRGQPDAYLDETFGEGGHLARAAGGAYETRPGQVQLARAVDQAIRERAAAFVEGPTGTGKSKGYLVPAIHHAVMKRGRVIVSTASIALQEQLVEKDLPELQAALPYEFTFALLKGRGNYLCNDRRNPKLPRSLTHRELEQLEQLKGWALTTKTGDRTELDFVPLERLWRRFTVDSDDCADKDCDHYEACFYKAARAKAAQATVLVVNHHLLCADAYLRSLEVEPILPEAAALIVDEAHELADVARDFWGYSTGTNLVDRAATWVAERGGDSAHARGLGEAFFAELEAHARAHDARSRGSDAPPAERDIKAPLSAPGLLSAAAPFAALLEQLRDQAASCLAKLDAKAKNVGLSKPEKKERAKARSAERRFKKAVGGVRAAEQAPANLACWAELRPLGELQEEGDRRVRLEVRTLDVTGSLAHVFDPHGAAVLTSATLTVAGSFDFLRRETGLQPDLTLEVPSPFDHAARCLVVLPEGMPLPDSPAWPAACALVVRRLVDAADGRTLALFSSRRAMERTYAAVANTSSRTWLKQGDLPSRQLAVKFKTDARSVLFGTKTFWTGVDVPGESLVAVFIDRIPFPQREDPVLEGLRRLAGSRWFDEVDLPRALMQVRQGIGRLIRAKTDYGVVVLGDRRVATKGWGRKLWASLPRTARGKSSADVAAFLARFQAGAAE
jgi:ATP-dependent DNA helicase DinG